jgi:hypothetical protein
VFPTAYERLILHQRQPNIVDGGPLQLQAAGGQDRAAQDRCVKPEIEIVMANIVNGMRLPIRAGFV